MSEGAGELRTLRRSDFSRGCTWEESGVSFDWDSALYKSLACGLIATLLMTLKVNVIHCLSNTGLARIYLLRGWLYSD